MAVHVRQIGTSHLWKVSVGRNPDVTTWEESALKALLAIDVRRELPSTDQEFSLRVIEMLLADTKSSVNSDTWNRSDLVESLVLIGCNAMDHVSFEPSEIALILAEKQAAYGPGNILAFGLAGIHVRVSDKVARLRNLIDKERTTLANFVEPLEDSWLDLVGYATLAVMLQNDTFENPLERDLPTPESIADEAAAELRRQMLEVLGGE